MTRRTDPARRLRWLPLLFVPLLGFACPAPTTEGDDDVGDDDDATWDPEDEVVVEPEDPPEGVTVTPVQGQVELPAGLPFAPEELTVATAWGGEVRVRPDGTFTSSMNASATGILELRAPDGSPLWWATHARSEHLADDTPVLGLESAAATLLFFSPGLTVDDPDVAAIVLELLRTRPSFPAAVAVLEAAVAADPYAWSHPSEELTLALDPVIGELLELAPETHAALLEAWEGSGLGDEARDDPAELADTSTSVFHDLDGRHRDRVKLTAQVHPDNEPPTMNLEIENHGARPVWVYQDNLDSDYESFGGDDFRVLALVPPRNTAIPSLPQLVEELGVTAIGAILALFVEDVSSEAWVQERLTSFVNATIGPATESLSGVDLTDYEHSVISVYGAGLPIATELNYPALAARHWGPSLHAVVRQFVFPILAVLANQNINTSNYARYEVWATWMPVVETLATSVDQILRTYAAERNYQLTMYALIDLFASQTALIWDALEALGAMVLGPIVRTQLQTALGVLVDMIMAWGVVIDVLNAFLVPMSTLITILEVDWTDTYVLDLEPEPDRFLVCGRSPSLGGVAGFEIGGDDYLGVTRVDFPGAEPLLGSGSTVRDIDIGGPFGDWAYATRTDGTLAVFDLLEGNELELDQDVNASTTDPGAPDGVSRITLGDAPRGIDVGEIEGAPYGFVALSDGIVVFDAWFMWELYYLSDGELGISSGLRPYDIVAIEDEKLYVTLNGSSDPGGGVLVVDMREAAGYPHGAPLVRGTISTGACDNQWMEPSPDGTMVAVTCPESNRVAIIDVATDSIHDVGDPGFPTQFGVPLGEPWALWEESHETAGVAWATDGSAVYAGFISGGYSHSLGGYGVVRRCPFDLGYCQHEVGVEGALVDLAVIEVGGLDRVLVTDFDGRVTVLEPYLFEPGADTSGVNSQGLFDGTGGCLNSTGRAIPCPSSASIDQIAGRLVPYP